MIAQFCDWLAATSLSQSFASAAWFVPAVQTVHILGVAVLLTLLALLDVRLLGLAVRWPMPAEMAQSYLPWVWRALLVLLISGVLLTIAEPARELLNTLFRVKMILVLVVAAVTWKLQLGLRRNLQHRVAAVLGAVSLALLIAIVTAGRWIAYV